MARQRMTRAAARRARTRPAKTTAAYGGPLGLLVGEDEIGTSKNDAIIRLALAGARVVASAREVAEKREARWQALLASDAVGGELPDADEMRAASFTLRDHAD